MGGFGGITPRNVPAEGGTDLVGDRILEWVREGGGAEAGGRSDEDFADVLAKVGGGKGKGDAECEDVRPGTRRSWMRTHTRQLVDSHLIHRTKQTQRQWIHRMEQCRSLGNVWIWVMSEGVAGSWQGGGR